MLWRLELNAEMADIFSIGEGEGSLVLTCNVQCTYGRDSCSKLYISEP